MDEAPPTPHTRERPAQGEDAWEPDDWWLHLALSEGLFVLPPRAPLHDADEPPEVESWRTGLLWGIAAGLWLWVAVGALSR